MKNCTISQMKETDIPSLVDFLQTNQSFFPHLILLNGEVGTGKTTFSRYYIEATNTKKNFSSPTYNIVSVYDDISPHIQHFDIYRISEDDYDWIYEQIDTDDILIFEWSNLHPELFDDEDWIKLSFEYEDLETRTLTFEASDEQYLKKIGEFIK